MENRRIRGEEEKYFFLFLDPMHEPRILGIFKGKLVTINNNNSNVTLHGVLIVKMIVKRGKRKLK